MELFLGSEESNNRYSQYTEDSRLRHHLHQCECEILLANHFSGCICNIFNRTLCSFHHTFQDGELSTMNCHSVRRLSDEY